MKGHVVSGIDLGSGFIRAVMLQSLPSGEWQLIGAAEEPSQGIVRGTIANIDETVSAVSACLERLERMSSVPVTAAAIGIGNLGIVLQQSSGVVAVAKADRVIGEADVDRAFEAARSVAIQQPNLEMLVTVPFYYNVDQQTHIKDPIGLNGIRLEAVAKVILCPSAQIRNVARVMARSGVEVIDQPVFSPLAAAEAVLTSKQKELGVGLVNVGYSTTSVAVYEEGDLLQALVLPVGSSNITNDIAIALRTSLEAAEAIKMTYGQADLAKVNKRDEFDLSKFSDQEAERTFIPIRQVAEVVSARVEEMLVMVDKELKKINRSGMLPAGLVFIGGGSKLPGFIEMAKEKMRLPCFLGAPAFDTSMIDKVSDPQFIPALGLALWAIRQGGDVRGSSNSANSLSSFASKLKNLIKPLLP
ncbi:MAG: cell division protein FtsA [Candidatus Komeilibacteria bacterium]|nr:cell division protein FtsA [Candidatus Komeilibacteria bacterium]